jgi:hypothetical protein
MIEFPRLSIGRVRTSLTHAVWIGATLASLAISSRPAQAGPSGNDPFLLLLKGIYQPVNHAPDLGLVGINLNDGSFSVTDIHPITTVPGVSSNNNAVAGKFYVQFNGDLAVYDLPGGSIAMRFTSADNPTTIDDGQGGFYIEQTFELTIIQATGIYKSFVGGHNHMVDRAHVLASGAFDENCICIISLPSALPLWWSSN